MNMPIEAQWCRVEELSEELGRLSRDQAAVRLAELAAEGESRTVLTLLGVWHSLPPPEVGLAAGSVIEGGYTLREKIGDGGMGSVWRATQRTIERDVAVKILHSALASPALRNRSLDEVRILGRLNHPGIVRIFDAGFHEDPRHGALPYFAMELVEGLTLSRWAARHRTRRGAVLEVMVAVCDAVQAAHDRGIVHRDLKPANILVREDGRPVVLDFGIARLSGLSDGDGGSAFSGTPQYAAPEQHLGRDRDFRSGESVDVYGLGALLFEVLTGRRLFEFPPGTPFAEMRRAVVDDPAPRLASVLPDCPAELDDIVARAVRRDPADRYYSVSALGRAISRVAAAVPRSAPPKPWEPVLDGLVPGTRWRLVERIGEGGAGEVWLGRHEELGERRVFKFCSTEEKVRTLRREYTLFRLLKERVGRHPHFLQLREVSLDEPPWYLMMDYDDERDLTQWCATRPGGLGAMPESTRVELVAQAAEALQAAHEAGILHRDIKPSNLLVRPGPEGSGDAGVHVLIADFGIGQIVLDRLRVGDQRLGFTRTVSGLQPGEWSGTILYLAPEVMEGGPGTARSDIYSLGVVFWQLLVGNLGAALDPTDWPARVMDPLLREDLHRCLAGAPEKRWAGAGELAASLRALPGRRAADVRRRTELAARERAAYRRGVVRTTVVAAGVFVLVAWMGGYAFVQSREATDARGQARTKALANDLNELGKLALGSAPNRIRQAREVVGRGGAWTADERQLLAGAFVQALEEDDWSVHEQHPAGLDAGLPCLEYVLDPASGTLLRWRSDGQVDLLDTATGQLRWVRPQPAPGAPVMALGPGARTLAIAVGGQVWLWNGQDGVERSTWTTATEVSALAWSVDGGILGVGRAGVEGIGVVELRTGPGWGVEATLARAGGEPFSRPPSGLAFSPDGRRLAHWSRDSLHLLCWDVAGRQVAAFAYHPAPVSKAVWSSDAQLYSTASDHFLYRWDIGEAWTNAAAVDQPAGRYPTFQGVRTGHARSWTQFMPLRDGQHFAAADEAGNVFCFELVTGRDPLRWSGTKPVVGIAVGDQGLTFHRHAAGSETVRRVRSPFRRTVSSRRLSRIEDFDVSPDGALLACGGIGGVVIFDRALAEHVTVEGLAWGRGVRFLGADRLAVSARFGDVELIWDEAAKVLRTGPLPGAGAFLATNRQETPARIALASGSRHVATARARSIRWSTLDAANAVELACADDAAPEEVALAAGGGRLAWVDRKEQVWVVDPAGGAVAQVPGTGRRIGFLEEGRCLISGSHGVRVLMAPGSEPVPVEGLDSGDVAEMVAQERGNLAAVALRTGGILLGTLAFEGVPRWRSMVRLGAGAGGSYARLRFAGDGRWLGAISSDDRLTVWDVTTLCEELGRAQCLPGWFSVRSADYPVPAAGAITP